MNSSFYYQVNKDGYMAADDDSDLDMSVLIPSTSNSSPSTDTAENILPPVLGAAAAPPLPQVVATAASSKGDLYLSLYALSITVFLDLLTWTILSHYESPTFRI